MKLIAVALMIALFSAGLGVVDDLAAQTGESWFNGSIDPDMPENDWQNLTVSMSTESDGGLFDDVAAYLEIAYTLAMTMISAMKGVLFVGTIINDMFYFEVAGRNVVPIISGVINLGTWIIYIIGLYQFKHGDSIQHYM